MNVWEQSLADWTQAIIALAAYLLAPATVQYLWNQYRYRFTVTGMPIDLHMTGSRRWQLKIENKTSKMQRLHVTIFPQRPKTLIISATITPSNDGGFEVSEKEISNGAIIICLERIAPKRLCYINFIMDKESLVGIYTKEGSAKFNIDLRKYAYQNNLASKIFISKLRLRSFLISYTFLIAIIIIYLIILGILR